MESRPMPPGAVVFICGLLLGTASVMAWQSLALAADGSFQLVRVLGSGDVYGLDARILAAWTHQGLVVLTARAGVTDTHVLSILLGVGQLVVPATAWSLAIVLTRADRLVCAAVAMVAGLSAGMTWLVNVDEAILAVPLTTVVAALLWQPRAWRWRDISLAIVMSFVLVASYETAVLTGLGLAVWAVWRSANYSTRREQVGCAIVAALSALSVVVAISGTQAGRSPTNAQSVLYFVVSLEPWPFYVAVAGVAIVIAALGPWLGGTRQRAVLALGCTALVVATVGLEPSPVAAFRARGGAVVVGLALELFLWWRWFRSDHPRRTSADHEAADEPRVRLLVAVPALFVAAMVAANIQPVRKWTHSLNAFRTEVAQSHGITEAALVLPADRRSVLWDWTSSSLSLLVRSGASDGILVDRHPSLVPFPSGDARSQLDDAYTWRP